MGISDRTIGEFLDAIAGADPTPGGGSSAAVGGALAAALLEMVCRVALTHGEATDPAALREARSTLVTHRQRLLELADEDVEAFEAVMAAHRQSAGDGRERAIEEATQRATTVPIDVASRCVEILERVSSVATAGSEETVTDAGAAAYLAHAAVETTLDTARLNLEYLDDEEFVSETETAVDHLGERADARFAEARSTIESRL